MEKQTEQQMEHEMETGVTYTGNLKYIEYIIGFLQYSNLHDLAVRPRKLRKSP